jgi:SMODS and SLOG-associating 2TM effector domain 3
MDDAGPVTGDEDGTAGGERATVTRPRKEEKKKRRRPALLARFPKLFWHPSAEGEWTTDSPLVKRDQINDYPALEADLKLWCEHVEPQFRRLDHQALILQNQFWRQNVILIAGGLVATALGAVQAAAGGGVVALAVAEAVITGMLVGLTVLIRSRRAQGGYLSARLRAERIKSEFFLFLARAGDYSAGDPVAQLQQQVSDIEDAEDVW